MDEKRDNKRTKTTLIKNVMNTYLEKRNFSFNETHKMSEKEQKISILLESEISRPNSILFTSYNIESNVIEQNFNEFTLWLKGLLHSKSEIYEDLRKLSGPIFLHFYIDMLKRGDNERASTFFETYLPSIDRSKCDGLINNFLMQITSKSDISAQIERYRSNKYRIRLKRESVELLKNFVLTKCHIIMLETLQMRFDLQEISEFNVEYDSSDEENDKLEMRDEEMVELKPQDYTNSGKLRDKFLQAIDNLKKIPKQIFTVRIANTKNHVACALINRRCNLIAYNQGSVLHLRSIDSCDSVLGYKNCKEIKLETHSERIYSVTLSPNLDYLVSASADKTLSIYKLNDTELLSVCKGHLLPVYCAEIANNNQYLASGSQDTTARLWDLTTGKTLRIFSGHTQSVTCLNFHTNCLYLATGSADQTIRLWNIDDGGPLRLFLGAKGAIYTIAFSPLGDTLAGASDDGYVRVWDVLTAKLIVELKYKHETITKMKWSDDGKQLCCGANDGCVRIWNFGAIQENLEDTKTHEPIECFNVNGKVLNIEYSFQTFACVAA